VPKPAEHLSCEVLSVQLTVRHRPDVCILCHKKTASSRPCEDFSLSDSQEARKVTDENTSEDLSPLLMLTE